MLHLVGSIWGSISAWKLHRYFLLSMCRVIFMSSISMLYSSSFSSRIFEANFSMISLISLNFDRSIFDPLSMDMYLETVDFDIFRVFDVSIWFKLNFVVSIFVNWLFSDGRMYLYPISRGVFIAYITSIFFFTSSGFSTISVKSSTISRAPRYLPSSFLSATTMTLIILSPILVQNTS